MPIFRGQRQNRRGGAGAGRGDNPHEVVDGVWQNNPFQPHVENPKDPFAGYGKTWGQNAQGGISYFRDDAQKQHEKENPSLYAKPIENDPFA